MCPLNYFRFSYFTCPQTTLTLPKTSPFDFATFFNHTSGVTAITPTDRPKSVRNRCVINVFGGGFCMLSCCFLNFSVVGGFFYHRTESDIFLYLFAFGLVPR